MRVGVAVPQAEIASDVRRLGRFVRGVEELGYDHLLVFDHVVGVARGAYPNWTGPYDLADPFHEPLVLLAWIAAQTTTVELATGVLVLPQRQTALVAKQAAEVDVLSGGRLRLGVGVGWNQSEYHALGVPFGTRGRRIEEQIRLLRRLWAEPHVTFRGRWDQVAGAGLNPRPVQRPIPIWMGGSSDAVVSRAIALADGWMPMLNPGAVAKHKGWNRTRPSIGLEGRISLREIDPDGWIPVLRSWRDLKATHVTVNTSGMGLGSVDAHLSTLRAFRAAVAASTPAGNAL